MSKLIKLIEEKTSPLFRVMTAFNYDLDTKTYKNNIICSHIGNGYFISVAHNLRKEHGIPPSIPNVTFMTKYINCLTSKEQANMKSKFKFDSARKRWIYKNVNDAKEVAKIRKKLNQCSLNTTYLESYKNGVAKPFLLLQFRDQDFFNSDTATKSLASKNYTYKENVKRHTYFLELELYHASWSNDICIYKLEDKHKDIIPLIPSLSIDTTLYDGTENLKIYSLQSSPISTMGRLLNEAKIEGISDHFSQQKHFKPSYILEGMRYLMIGYFRFGSSGAPYILHNQENDTFSAFAIQSEACPLQLSINSKQTGNFQYTKALASPLSNIKSILADLKK